MSEIADRKIKIIDGDTAFCIKDEKQFKALDFWQWAFSDLVDNTTRGILGEFIVGKALGIDMTGVKYHWGICDLVQSDGTKIEVKTSAYMQTWNESKISNINFSGLKSKNVNGLDNGDEERYNSDFYIFCIQTSKSHEEYDQFSLDQWMFKIVPREILARKKVKSISLGSLQKIAPDTFDFKSLGEGLESLKRSMNKQ